MHHYLSELSTFPFMTWRFLSIYYRKFLWCDISEKLSILNCISKILKLCNPEFTFHQKYQCLLDMTALSYDSSVLLSSRQGHDHCCTNGQLYFHTLLLVKGNREVYLHMGSNTWPPFSRNIIRPGWLFRICLLLLARYLSARSTWYVFLLYRNMKTGVLFRRHVCKRNHYSMRVAFPDIVQAPLHELSKRAYRHRRGSKSI